VSNDESTADGKKLYIDEWYRWGYVFVTSDEKPMQASNPYEDPLVLDDYSIEDQSYDDGVALDFVFPEEENWTEEEKAWVESIWEEDFWSGLEDNGIQIDDVYTEFYGPLEITKIDDGPQDEPEDDTPPTNPKATWPF
jgi:hypothetical protein